MPIRRFGLCLCLLSTLFLAGCADKGGLFSDFDRGGRQFRFTSDGRFLFDSHALRYEIENDSLLLYRFEGEPPFRCSVSLDEDSGVLMLNGLPYYRISR